MDRVDPLLVIGDALNVVGFGLAGVAVRSPAPADLEAAFEQALATAQLVVLGRRAADALGPERLRRVWAREQPLLVVLPDIAAPVPDTALEHRLRAVLGIDA